MEGVTVKRLLYISGLIQMLCFCDCQFVPSCGQRDTALIIGTLASYLAVSIAVPASHCAWLPTSNYGLLGDSSRRILFCCFDCQGAMCLE